MLSVYFPQESVFRDAGHSVHSYVLLIETDGSFHIIKLLAALKNNLSTESIDEECAETVHVLICEADWVQFL